MSQGSLVGSQAVGSQVVQPILIAKIDDARVISQLLNAIHFKKEQLMTMVISKHAIECTVENAKSLQATVSLKAGLFTDYRFWGGDDATKKDDEAASVNFQVNLTALINCLEIFSSPSHDQATSVTALQLCYQAEGNPLVLMLEENGVVTDCGILTLESTELMDFNSAKVDMCNKVILQSAALKEILLDADWTGDIVELLISPDQSMICFSNAGSCGESEFILTANSDPILKFDCQQTFSNRYKLSQLQQTARAFASASETCLRMNAQGMLSLQSMIRSDATERVSFVEFVLCAEENMDDSF